MMPDEVYHRTIDKLHTLSEVYRNIQGGPEVQRKPLVQLTDMMAEIIEHLHTEAKGQV